MSPVYNSSSFDLVVETPSVVAYPVSVTVADATVKTEAGIAATGAEPIATGTKQAIGRELRRQLPVSAAATHHGQKQHQRESAASSSRSSCVGEGSFYARKRSSSCSAIAVSSRVDSAREKSARRKLDQERAAAAAVEFAAAKEKGTLSSYVAPLLLPFAEKHLYGASYRMRRSAWPPQVPALQHQQQQQKQQKQQQQQVTSHLDQPPSGGASDFLVGVRTTSANALGKGSNRNSISSNSVTAHRGAWKSASPVKNKNAKLAFSDAVNSSSVSRVLGLSTPLRNAGAHGVRSCVSKNSSRSNSYSVSSSIINSLKSSRDSKSYEVESSKHSAGATHNIKEQTFTNRRACGRVSYGGTSTDSSSNSGKRESIGSDTRCTSSGDCLNIVVCGKGDVEQRGICQASASGRDEVSATATAATGVAEAVYSGAEVWPSWLRVLETMGEDEFFSEAYKTIRRERLLYLESIRMMKENHSSLDLLERDVHTPSVLSAVMDAMTSHFSVDSEAPTLAALRPRVCR